jgi:hypothetical protein
MPEGLPATDAFHFGFRPLGTIPQGSSETMTKTKHDNIEASRNSRSPWTRPSLRRLATSEAENNPGSHTPDAEGFLS